MSLLQVAPMVRILITRSVAIVPALAVALAYGTGSSSSTAVGGIGLDQLNQGLNLLQSIQLPFALLPVSVTGTAHSWREK